MKYMFGTITKVAQQLGDTFEKLVGSQVMLKKRVIMLELIIKCIKLKLIGLTKKNFKVRVYTLYY